MQVIEGEYLWTEKYRPQVINDVILPEHLKETFRGYVRDKQVANLLLTSATPGTGKTTIALAMCHELGIRPLFINASIRNSIGDIRTDVVQYATTVSLFADTVKVVILDEADRLSPEAQDSLKGLIEEVSKNCRFILTANTKSRITEPLASRCANIEFVFNNEEVKKTSAFMFKRACEMLDAEGVEYSKPVIATLVKKYVPDNRQLITKLQQYSTAHKRIDEGILSQTASADIEGLFENLKGKKFELVKQWCFDNQTKLSDDFYGVLFLKMEPRLEQNSVPELVLILDEWQTKHSIVPDRYIHFLAMMTHVMMKVQFK